MANTLGALGSAANDACTLCKRTWWVFLIGGLASIVFGVLAFTNPGVALAVLAMFFAAWVLVDGAFNALGALQHRGKDGWWLMLLIGLLGIGVGLYALLRPPVAIGAFVLLIAFQSILLGALLVLLGYKVRKVTSREWILYLAGALSVLFGVLVIAQPAAGGLTIVYLIASWAILIGALKITFGFRVKNLPDRIGDRIQDLR